MPTNAEILRLVCAILFPLQHFMAWTVKELSQFKCPRPTYRSQVLGDRLNAGRTYSKVTEIHRFQKSLCRLWPVLHTVKVLSLSVVLLILLRIFIIDDDDDDDNNNKSNKDITEIGNAI
jgi:hypothetical protein